MPQVLAVSESQPVLHPALPTNTGTVTHVSPKPLATSVSLVTDGTVTSVSNTPSQLSATQDTITTVEAASAILSR